MALLDFSSAFDLVGHDILLLKLKGYNFSDGTINWIKSYLTGRISMVNINSEFSSPIKIVCGSCLGPMLFSLFINDLPSVLDTASITLYTDDSTPYQAAKNVNLISENLQNDLYNVEDWIRNNRLVLNVEKIRAS